MPEMGIILFAEDSQDDAFLLKRAFSKLDESIIIEHVKDGNGMIAFLSALKGKNGATRLPRLLLLDLKMPGCDGFDVLKWRRDHPEWLIIPAVIFSSSAEERDIIKTYELCGNSYAVKPSTLDGYLKFAEALRRWWLNQNRSPGIGPAHPFSSGRGY